MIKPLFAIAISLLLTASYARFCLKSIIKTFRPVKLLAVCFVCFVFVQADAQPRLHSLIKSYYKVDPFKASFAAFINVLSHDLSLTHKQEHKKNDSAGYYLRGKYEVFNPFNIPANSVDMIFYEDWLEHPELSNDTYYTYQITAYFPDTDGNRKKIIKEYNKLSHKIRRAYPNAHAEQLNGQKGVSEGEIQAFRNESFPLTTAVASWQTLPKTQQLGLTVMLRLKKDNLRLLPLTPADRPGKINLGNAVEYHAGVLY